MTGLMGFRRQVKNDLCRGFLTPVLMQCHCPERKTMLELYHAGSGGPKPAGCDVS